MRQPTPCFRPLLSQRLELYYLDLMCTRYQQAGTPFDAAGLTGAMLRRGFSPATIERYRFRFNVAVAMYADAIDRRKSETVQKNAPKDKSKTPKISVPKYTSLTALLNLPIEPESNTPEAEAQHDALVAAWDQDPEAFIRLLQEQVEVGT